MAGGVYALGGTKAARLNVTYNYADCFYRVMGLRGIRSIYGLTGAESIPVLSRAIEQLADDIDEDYWKATEGNILLCVEFTLLGNVKRALMQLRDMAQMRPDGIWSGD
ncbi:hypothetical protein M0R72_07575 [Candidatus Pacearchaeota archaeon]|nr:hypothetical protein [Candidatus Pacearchaeota archaeon]